MDPEDIKEAVALLNRSPLLDALGDGRFTRRDIEEQLDFARSTAYRTTLDLEERGLVAPTDGGYRSTSRGVAVAVAGKRYVEALAAAERIHPLLEFVDHPLLLRSLHLFDDADVLTPDADDPYRLIDWFSDRLAAVDRFRGFAAAVGNEEQFEIAAERVDTGADVEVVFSPRVLSRSASVAADAMAAALRQSNCAAYVNDDVPFSLALFDDTVTVIGIDNRTGLPGVCVSTERPEARVWAEINYRRYRQAADEVEAKDLVA